MKKSVFLNAGWAFFLLGGVIWDCLVRYVRVEMQGRSLFEFDWVLFLDPHVELFLWVWMGFSICVLIMTACFWLSGRHKERSSAELH